MTTNALKLGDSIKVAVFGGKINGFVTGFNTKNGRKIVDFEPGYVPPGNGTLGSNWAPIDNVLSHASNLKERCFSLVSDHIDRDGPGTDLQIEYEQLSTEYGDSPNHPVWAELLRSIDVSYQ